MLGLRNRSIFILLSVLFQLLMAADPQADQTRAYATTHTEDQGTRGACIHGSASQSRPVTACDALGNE